MKMKQLIVDTGVEQYPIHIGEHILTEGSSLLDTSRVTGDIVVVTNEVIAAYYLQPLQALLGDRLRKTFYVQDGEQHKSIETWSTLLSEMLELRLNRSATACGRPTSL